MFTLGFSSWILTLTLGAKYILSFKILHAPLLSGSDAKVEKPGASLTDGLPSLGWLAFFLSECLQYSSFLKAYKYLGVSSEFVTIQLLIFFPLEHNDLLYKEMNFIAENFSFIISSNRSFLAKFFSLGRAPLQTPIIFMMDHPYDDLNCFSFGGGGSFLLLSLELSKAFPYISNSIFGPYCFKFTRFGWMLFCSHLAPLVPYCPFHLLLLPHIMFELSL